MAALIFGIADFAGDIGAKELTKEQFQVYHYPKMQTIVAARAAGIDCIDNVTLQFRDLDQCRKDAEYACKMGFDGKWAIHPYQVKIINEVFTPSKDELTRATESSSSTRRRTSTRASARSSTGTRWSTRPPCASSGRRWRVARRRACSWGGRDRRSRPSTRRARARRSAAL